MPYIDDLKLPTSSPPSTPLTLDNWKKGVITLTDPSKIPKDALIKARNIFLAEEGTPTIRPGVDWFGTAPTSPNQIDGAGMYETSAGAPHLVVVSNGTVYRSTDDGTTWTACTGATATIGSRMNMLQDHGYLYLTNGTDNIVRYDGTTVLATYTALTTPGVATIVETGTGLTSGTNYNHYWKIVAVNAVGFTAAGAASTVIQTGIDRISWGDTNYATLTWSAVTNATRYDIYYSNDNIDYFYLDTTIGNTSVGYLDNGTAIPNTNIVAPTANTTQGPKIKRLEQIGSRMWGTEDTDNPWRVWFSGSGQYAGYFASAYDGGYIDLMKGSQYRPVRVVDYRDGKGTPYATVWCKSPDGRGCIWQITLEVLTIGDVSITVPSAYRLPGSRGTDAPDSVVNVLNDYMFFNSQAFYNLGSRAQFLNLLSTDESSANIRPTIKSIRSTASRGISSIYFEAKVYWSVPYGSATNNYTIVYDTERKAWLPEAFDIGFTSFFGYVTVAGARKLLTWKPGDTRLSEISDNIDGDYGDAFETELITGLYPVSRNRFDFMWVEEAEIEFSQPIGEINIELLGIERKDGYKPIKSKTLNVTSTSSGGGWDTFDWDTMEWDDTSGAEEAESESSVKRYFTVQSEINAFQWRITTSTRIARYLTRTLQITGTLSDGEKPRGWRL